MSSDRGLYVVLVSAHGLIRGVDPELGRDADTGGQVLYVLELARALARHPAVDRVDLLTRQILSVEVGAAYARPLEPIADGASIVRLPFGPHRYLRKESLWPYLPQMVDQALRHFRSIGRVPDVVHSHYADAGEVAVRLGRVLDAVLVHTGHSLGRVKRERLLAAGLEAATIEARYRMERRIAAEEEVIARADLIVASTEQEVSDQYGLYDSRPGSRLQVIPPGVDLSRFRPPRRGERPGSVATAVDRFLREPSRPLVLALQRPDERKNLGALIGAFGRSHALRERANLAVIVGNRDDIEELSAGPRQVYRRMLAAIDRHDLYGTVAYPKQHSSEDVPDLYRLAAMRRGVFVNPALTEPFGLTLIEAAASGLPLVATNDGGPQTIVGLCRNGLLVDPLDEDAIAASLLEVIGDRREWRRRARRGLAGVRRHFTWEGHVARYLAAVRRIRRRRVRSHVALPPPGHLVIADRLLVVDIDHTLVGDPKSLEELVRWLSAHRREIAFGVATGRTLPSALAVLREERVPRPDLYITAVGTEIHYRGDRLVEDRRWGRRIDHRWERQRLEDAVAELPGVILQSEDQQREFKLSFDVDPERFPGARPLKTLLREHRLEARVVLSHDRFLDLLPARASKGSALQWVAHRWGFSLDRVLVAGDSGNDLDMLRAGARAVVVGNHRPEMRSLRGREGVYFAHAGHAAGILEGMAHHGFGAGSESPAGSDSESRGEDEAR